MVGLLGSLRRSPSRIRPTRSGFWNWAPRSSNSAVTGSIKFDRVETDRRNPKTLELRAAFGIGESEPVFIAGSTQESEEAAAIDAYLAVRSRFRTCD